VQAHLISREGETVLDCCGGSGSMSFSFLLNHRNVVYVEKDEVQYNNFLMRLKTDLPLLLDELQRPVELPASCMEMVAEDASKLAMGAVVEQDCRYLPAEWLLNHAEPKLEIDELFERRLCVNSDDLKAFEAAARAAWKSYAIVRVSFTCR
jgi:hypothetical protein